MFARIDLKLFAVIGSVVTLGLVILMLFFSEREEQHILAQNKRILINVLDSTHRGLKTLMLSGYGDAGPTFSEGLENMQGLVDLRIMRLDGSQAFLDNRSINQVNKQVGYEQFYPRDEELFRQVLPSSSSALMRVMATQELIELYDISASGERLYTLLYPIVSEPDCVECHIGGEPLLGVIKLTTSLKQVDQDIAASRNQSLVVLGVSLLLVMLTLSLFLRRAVVAPIQTISQAMHDAAEGDLSQRVPVPSQTELRQMAESFNRMISELEVTHSGLHQERNKLSTIILGAQEGMIATDAAGRIVLVNPAAERLLNSDLSTLAQGGLEQVFEDSQWPRLLEQGRTRGKTINCELQQQGKNLQIQLASIANTEGEPIGTAVLMRDITQEKAMRRRLEYQSRTDALTGLFNRRYFDQELLKEFLLSERYQQPVSLVLFDIDHFKQFNDNHGHDQGDRVLQQVAEVARQLAQPVDLVCRYGGEEFALIMPGTPRLSAAGQAERLRQAIAAVEVDGLRVTCSLGVASIPDAFIDSPETLVKTADQALYSAKQNGRNRVEQALPEG